MKSSWPISHLNASSSSPDSLHYALFTLVFPPIIISCSHMTCSSLHLGSLHTIFLSIFYHNIFGRSWAAGKKGTTGCYAWSSLTPQEPGHQMSCIPRQHVPRTLQGHREPALPLPLASPVAAPITTMLASVGFFCGSASFFFLGTQTPHPRPLHCHVQWVSPLLYYKDLNRNFYLSPHPYGLSTAHCFQCTVGILPMMVERVWMFINILSNPTDLATMAMGRNNGQKSLASTLLNILYVLPKIDNGVHASAIYLSGHS